MTNIKPLSFFNIRIWSFTLYITVKLDLDGLRDKKKKKLLKETWWLLGVEQLIIVKTIAGCMLINTLTI